MGQGLRHTPLMAPPLNLPRQNTAQIRANNRAYRITVLAAPRPVRKVRRNSTIIVTAMNPLNRRAFLALLCAAPIAACGREPEAERMVPAGPPPLPQ